MLARKLKSSRGMSIIMGLLLLLVCAMAGAAALTSAASNAGRYTHMRRDQQRYLAVASAARLVRDELCAGTYTASASFTRTIEYHSSTDPVTGETSWYTVGPFYKLKVPAAGKDNEYTGTFEDWLDKGGHMEDVFLAGETPDNWWDLTHQSKPSLPADLKYTDLTVKADNSEPLLSQVKWTLEMREDYSLYATFWLEDKDKDGKTSTYYTTTMTIPANAEVSETMTSKNTSWESTTVTTRTLTVEWPASGAVIWQS